MLFDVNDLEKILYLIGDMQEMVDSKSELDHNIARWMIDTVELNEDELDDVAAAGSNIFNINDDGSV